MNFRMRMIFCLFVVIRDVINWILQMCDLDQLSRELLSCLGITEILTPLCSSLELKLLYIFGTGSLTYHIKQ